MNDKICDERERERGRGAGRRLKEECNWSGKQSFGSGMCGKFRERSRVMMMMMMKKRTKRRGDQEEDDLSEEGREERTRAVAADEWSV
jgi:hypothetical protein